MRAAAAVWGTHTPLAHSRYHGHLNKMSGPHMISGLMVDNALPSFSAFVVDGDHMKLYC